MLRIPDRLGGLILHVIGATQMKAALERVARRQGESIAQTPERAVASRFEQSRADVGDDHAQQRLHQAATRWLGKLRGADRLRSQRVSETLRARRKKRRDG